MTVNFPEAAQSIRARSNGRFENLNSSDFGSETVFMVRCGTYRETCELELVVTGGEFPQHVQLPKHVYEFESKGIAAILS